jgi:ligand-binding sensor protein
MNGVIVISLDWQAPGLHSLIMDLYEIKSEQQWEALLAEVADRTAMVAALNDAEGNMLKVSGPRDPLCAAVRANNEASTFICAQTSRVMLAELKRSLRPAVDECDIGLQRIAVPIVRGGEVVGQVTACGTAESLDEVDPEMIALQLGCSEEQVQQLLASTRTGSSDALQAEADRVFALLNP